MTALDMMEDSFPHGTTDGYRQGCRTNHCPAPIVCHVVRTRYASDWTFRKRIDAGWTAAEILAQDEVETVAATAAERASMEWQRWSRRDREHLARLHGEGYTYRIIARTLGRTTTGVATAAKRMGLTEAGRKRVNSAVVTEKGIVRMPWTDDALAELRRLTDEGVADEKIAAVLGRSKHAIHTKRNELKWHKQKAEKVIPHGSYAGYAAGCGKSPDCPSTPTCHEAAVVYWREQSEAKRRDAGTEPRKRFTEDDFAQVRELHAQGMTRRAIAAQVGMSGAYVGRIVKAAA